MYLLHLFSFIPLLALTSLAGIHLQNDSMRNPQICRLALSSGILLLAGLVQTLDYLLIRPDGPYLLNSAVLGSLSILYFAAFLLLEDAVYFRRIRESFYQGQYRKRLRRAGLFLAVLLVIVLSLTLFSLQDLTGEKTLPLPLEAAGTVRFLLLAFTLTYIGLHLYSLTELFSFRRGTIRRNYYLFPTTLSLHLLLALPILLTDGLNRPLLFPLFLLANILYMVRVYGYFFADTITELRGIIIHLKQRAVTQNNLIRRLINAPEQEDLELLRSTVEEAVDRSRSLLVNPDYGITGVTVYTRKGPLLKLENRRLILGFCSPITRNRSLKNMSRRQVNETIFRQSFPLDEISGTPSADLTDPASQILKSLLTEKEAFILQPLPPYLRGIHRMVAFYPVFDDDHLLALLVIFKDNFDKIYPAEERELKVLSNNLTVISMIRRGKAEIRERNRLQGEMEIAQGLQESIVPKKLPIPGYDTAASMTPASEVGGDIYDYKNLSRGHYLAIGDVSGHGLPAGITAALQMAAFHGVLEGTEISGSLDSIYDAVNRVLCTLNRDRIGSDKFMTMNYLREENGRFLHAGAHEIGLIYRAETGSVEERPQMATETGFMGISEYLVSSQSLDSFQLFPGDILLLYSDGIIEAANLQNEQFGMERLKTVLREKAPQASEVIIRSIRRELDLFRQASSPRANLSAEAPNLDDITLVIIKKLPS